MSENATGQKYKSANSWLSKNSVNEYENKQLSDKIDKIFCLKKNDPLFRIFFMKIIF